MKTHLYRIFLFQFVSIVIAAIAFGFFFGLSGFISALLGGACWFFPSLLFAGIFLRFSAGSFARILLFLYLGELVKFALSIVLLILAFKFISLIVLPFISGYIVAILAYGLWSVVEMVKK